MTTTEKLCPFDKKECIRSRCAVWVQEEEVCSFARVSIGNKRPPTPRPVHSPSSGALSGKFKDPLFG